jgi:hypothetical protein
VVEIDGNDLGGNLRHRQCEPTIATTQIDHAHSTCDFERAQQLDRAKAPATSQDWAWRTLETRLPSEIKWYGKNLCVIKLLGH